VNKIDKIFCKDFQNLMYDIFLKGNIDQSFSLSMISDAFFYFNPKNKKIFNKLIVFLRDSIRSEIQNVYSTAIFQMFILIERLGKSRNVYAPQFYKNLVFLFLEEYDNEIKREMILEGFEKFFNDNHDVPIDILLEPYLDQINSCSNYAMCDFVFLLKIVEHPRIDNKDITGIIQFLLNVCLNNVMYSRCANLILCLIFEKNIIGKKCLNASDINEIEYKFVDFVNMALDSYITNLSKEEDKFILETPYDIVSENFMTVNNQVKDTIIDAVKAFRKNKGRHSSCLLAILWNYRDSDDIICQTEELNKPKYEPLEVYYERKRKEQEEIDKKNYTKKVIDSLNKMQEDNSNILRSREILLEQKKIREERIKKKLAERRKIKNVISGIPSIDTIPKPPILFSQKKLKKGNSDYYNIFQLKKKYLINPNKIPTGQLNSNMLYAMNNETEQYKSKGVINENTKL
jgi:hypothetical protein